MVEVLPGAHRRAVISSLQLRFDGREQVVVCFLKVARSTWLPLSMVDQWRTIAAIATASTWSTSATALVEQDQPRERRKPLQEPCITFVFPVQIEIGNEAWHEDEIERSLAGHLIGDPHIAAASVSGLDRPHEVFRLA